jgi:stalled ribosome rescue protein Dom34
MHKYAAVWIDHKQARIFHIHPDGVRDAVVTAPLQNVHHRHPKGPSGVKEHPNDAKQFFHEVGRSLEGTEQVLVVGPSTAKLDFLRYLHGHDHALEGRIVGIETVDHPTDGQLVAYAKKYFDLSDRRDQGSAPG